jgi:SGNH hydrolase-like domain, acetyltransferase AlgX
MGESRSKHRGLRRYVPRVLQVLLGLLCGLGIAEAVFSARDHGAFPHLNIYVADAAYGVRLRPGATTKIAFGGSEVTSVAIHSGGFRGATAGAEPSAQKGEVLFVGDSQTFGLGVEVQQAFAARFAELAKLPVYNAGVPTWGPPEFARAIHELGQRRHPSTIVYVVNFANDAFEAERRNTVRHAVWDGWAVRRETAPAPATVAQFPGREWLFQRSHLVFALRQWWYRHGAGPAQNAERGTPSEGTFRDLFKLGQTLSTEQLAAREETERRAQLYENENAYAEEGYRRAEARVRALVWDKMKLGGAGYDPNAAGTVYLAADANPGDIVVPGLGEEGRPAYATAVYIRQAVELRNKFEAQLRALAQAALDSDEGKQILAALSERDRERVRVAAVRRKPLDLVRASSPLTEAVLKAKAEADALGVRFVLVALPIDVMVSDAEWPKHGKARVDLAPARVLIQDLVESVQAAGGVALDATTALAAAEPGAFLPGDIHMTPKGHEAVARALVAALKSPKPTAPKPQLTLAEGRSRVPPPEAWASVGGEVAVNGSSRCPVTKKSREWLYVRCTSDNPKAPQGVGLQVVEGGLGDAITWVKDGKMTLVAPIPKGSRLDALFTWSDGKTKRLRVEWDAAGSAPDMSMAFEDGVAASAPDAKASERVCACYQAAHAGASCSSLIANADSTCVDTYPNDCARLLACAQGDALSPPRCPAGSHNTGASLHCMKEAPAAATAPATAELLATPEAVTAELAAAASTLITSAIAFVGPKCRLGQDDIELLYGIPYDRCPTDADMVAAYQQAWSTFDALASRARLPGAAATFREKAGAFGEFTTVALQSQDTRGTAALYQDLALSYNRWQPGKAVAVDPPRLLDLYFGVAHLPSNDYLRNLHHDGDQRKAKFEASGQHFVWQRGPNGFEGPYLPDELRGATGFSNSY